MYLQSCERCQALNLRKELFHPVWFSGINQLTLHYRTIVQINITIAVAWQPRRDLASLTNLKSAYPGTDGIAVGVPTDSMDQIEMPIKGTERI